MKLSNIASTVIATLALVAGAAHAEDTTTPVSVNGGTVHFKGELVNAACSVNTDSSEQTVNLGQYRTAKFTKVGDTTSNIPFTIELNDCDPAVAKTAAVAFTGHTDTTAYSTQLGYGNWELSADRANAARRTLLEGGMEEVKVARVVGLASSALFDKANPQNPINRRISIVVMTKDAEAAALNETATLALPPNATAQLEVDGVPSAVD